MSRYHLVFGALAVAACQPQPVDTDTAVPAEPPVVTKLGVEQENYVAALTIDVSDPDSDLVGGTMHVSFDGDGEDHGIGSDVDLLGPSIHLEHLYSPCDVGRLVDVEASVVDAGGLQSNTWQDSFLLGGDVLNEYEPNDLEHGDYEYNAFAFEYGRAICGRVASTGVNSDNQYDGDFDFYKVSPRVQGTWTFTLRAAQPSSRFDVWVFPDGAPQGHYATSSTLTFDQAVLPGDDFFLAVMAASGPPGEYAITFE